MKKVSMLALVFVLASNGAMAGGFSLSEYSTTSLSRGFAGMGVVGDDYSAIISNPAGMTLVKDGIQLGASFVDIYANLKNNKGTETDSLNIFSPVPSFFAQTSINDKTKVGLAFYTPYGIGTDYDRNWWGRDEALKSEVVVYDFTLSGAYELNSKLSLGASVSTQYTTAILTNTASSGALYSEIKGNNGDDLTYAYTLGAMYSVNENNRYGISYRSKSKHNLTGTHMLVANVDIPSSPFGPLSAGTVLKGDAHATITLPENLMVSSYHKLDDRLALSASVKWTRWSRFKNLDVYGLTGLNRTVENWRDTWTFSVGAD